MFENSNNKLWIIGDSFADDSDDCWTKIISNNFKGKTYISTKGSRDFQTILDIFLKNLKNISADDFVILIIPTLIRVRLPLENPTKTIIPIPIESNFETGYDYFIGANSYSKNSSECRLESPLCDLDEFILTSELNNTISSITNSSEASKKNYLEILKCLNEYLPFKIFIWSWTDEFDSDLIMTKSKIKEKIGFWETINDEWIATNGKNGIKGDNHWSTKMHKAFADYLIVKFSQYFNL